jgi:hypothetical protein
MHAPRALGSLRDVHGHQRQMRGVGRNVRARQRAAGLPAARHRRVGGLDLFSLSRLVHAWFVPLAHLGHLTIRYRRRYTAARAPIR